MPKVITRDDDFKIGAYMFPDRKRPKKNIKAKRRQREKMTKASKRRNRKC